MSAVNQCIVDERDQSKLYECSKPGKVDEWNKPEQITVGVQ